MGIWDWLVFKPEATLDIGVSSWYLRDCAKQNFPASQIAAVAMKLLYPTENPPALMAFFIREYASCEVAAKVGFIAVFTLS